MSADSALTLKETKPDLLNSLLWKPHTILWYYARVPN